MTQYRQLPYRIVNDNAPNFLKDLKNAQKILKDKVEIVKKFLLCCSTEDRIFVKEKPDQPERLFDKNAEFALLGFGKKYGDYQKYMNGLYKTLESENVGQFMTNMRPFFFEKRDSFDNQDIYEYAGPKIFDYLEICQQVEKATPPGKKVVYPTLNLPACRGENDTREINKPNDGNMLRYLGKYCCIVLNKAGILPLFGGLNREFTLNVLYTAARDLKDFARKNLECKSRFAAHEQEKKTVLGKIEHKDDLDVFLKLQKDNDYNVGIYFENSWESYIKPNLLKGEELDCNYPDYLIDFISRRPHLWEDEFDSFIEYSMLAQKNYNDYAVQPLYSDGELLFGNQALKVNNLGIEGRYFHADLQFSTDGKNTVTHNVKAHIPKKYREVSMTISREKEEKAKAKKLSKQTSSIAPKSFKPRQKKKPEPTSNFIFNFTYIDEKDYKKGKKNFVTAKLKSFFLRNKFSKGKQKHCTYVYLPLVFDWEDQPDSKNRYEKLQEELKNVVKNLSPDDLTVHVDLGINELFTPIFGYKSEEADNNLYGSPIGTIVDVPFDNTELIRQKSVLNTKMSTLEDLIAKIKLHNAAKRKFEKRDSIRNKKTKEKYAELWNKIETSKEGFDKCLRRMHHKLAKGYMDIRRLWLPKGDGAELIRPSYAEQYRWIKLTKNVKSRLKSVALKGIVYKRGETPDYKGKEFGKIVESLEVTYGNIKIDFLKKLASFFATSMRDLGVKAVFMENLRDFAQEAKNRRRTNELLQVWSHRNLVSQIKMACSEYGIKVYDWVDPRFTSQQNPFIGDWLYRAKGSKEAISSDMKVYDADKIGATNIFRRVFQNKSDDLFLDCYTQDDDLIDKKGRILHAVADGLIFSGKTVKIPKSEKKTKKESKSTRRYFLHDGVYINKDRHYKALELIKDRYKTLTARPEELLVFPASGPVMKSDFPPELDLTRAVV